MFVRNNWQVIILFPKNTSNHVVKATSVRFFNQTANKYKCILCKCVITITWFHEVTECYIMLTIFHYCSQSYNQNEKNGWTVTQQMICIWRNEVYFEDSFTYHLTLFIATSRYAYYRSEFTSIKNTVYKTVFA